jgi:hypothetical protein
MASTATQKQVSYIRRLATTHQLSDEHAARLTARLTGSLNTREASDIIAWLLCQPETGGYEFSVKVFEIGGGTRDHWFRTEAERQQWLDDNGYRLEHVLSYTGGTL